jgi:DNA-binding NtrC family response regulator
VKKVRVLVVMPEEAARERMASDLASADCVVYACARFEEARDALDRVQPDVLVTNMRLQEYNGLSLVLRAADRCPSAKKFVCDPDGDPVLRRDADAFGATLLAETTSETLLAAVAA